LDDLAGLKRGNVRLYASQTIASYWLPPRLVRLRRTWPQIAVELFVGNTARVARAVREGEVELGLIEGAVTEPLLINTQIGSDRLVVVTSAARPWRTSRRSAVADLVACDWVVREPGSGTRSEFEEALRAQGIEPDRLNVLAEMPSNEAVLAAVATGGLVAAVSELAAGPMLNAGLLRLIPFDLPPRRFDLLQHRERQPSHATAAVVDVLWHGSAWASVRDQVDPAPSPSPVHAEIGPRLLERPRGAIPNCHGVTSKRPLAIATTFITREYHLMFGGKT
jgi:DNA-binding transcriptional LysR family regulator